MSTQAQKFTTITVPQEHVARVLDALAAAGLQVTVHSHFDPAEAMELCVRKASWLRCRDLDVRKAA